MARAEDKVVAVVLDEFQQRWIDEWMLSYVYNAKPVRRMLAPDIGGYDKWAGFWMQYSANAQVGRWYYVDGDVMLR